MCHFQDLIVRHRVQSQIIRFDILLFWKYADILQNVVFNICLKLSDNHVSLFRGEGPSKAGTANRFIYQKV